MLTRESVYVILFSIPIYQLLFYTVQLVSFKRRNPSKKYLGLLLLSMTTYLVLNALHFLGYVETFSKLYIVFIPVLLSIAPNYFLYILSITRENHDVKKRQRLVLFLPTILFLIANIIIISILNKPSRISLMQHEIFGQADNMDTLHYILLGSWISTIVMVVAQVYFAILKVTEIVKAETEMMRKHPSHLAYLEWQWILGISISVLVFLIINALIEMVLPMNHTSLVVMYNVLMLLCGGIAGYFGMKQDDLLNQVERVSSQEKRTGSVDTEDAIRTGDNKQPQTQVNFIAPEEAEDIHKKIIIYFESDKPYNKSNFSMYDLCDHLQISRRKISYVLNEVMQKNFYGVVNEYRIKDAEELLLQDDVNLLKIEALGEMVGFRSKSSFNACFKKVTGMTPSEYRSRYKES